MFIGKIWRESSSNITATSLDRCLLLTLPSNWDFKNIVIGGCHLLLADYSFYSW